MLLNTRALYLVPDSGAQVRFVESESKQAHVWLHATLPNQDAKAKIGYEMLSVDRLRDALCR